MASPDHWHASQITDAAVFYSRLSKWDDEFGGLPVHTIRRQLWYPLGLHSLDEPDGGGRFVMDISDTLAVKLDAVRAYKTQFPPGKERVFRLVESQNRYFGAAAGFEAGELLISTTLLGLGDLMGALFTETPALEKPFPPLVKIPEGFQTAYPRRNKKGEDPSTGLATIEALFIAAAFLGHWDETLLEKYHFGQDFLRINESLWNQYGLKNENK